MSKKGSTPTPTAPDPTTVANAQAAANQSTAQFQQSLNTVNSYGPDGSVVYTHNPSDPLRYDQTTTLSPQQQAIYNGQTSATAGALGIANQQLGRIGDALGQSVNPSAYGQVQYGAQAGPLQTGYATHDAQTSFDGGAPLQDTYGSGGQIQMGVAPTSQGVQYGYDPGGSIQYGYGSGGPIQRQVTGQNTMGAIQQAENAVYGQATSRLDPQWNQSAEQLQSQLTAQGLNSNDAAWQTAMQNFNNAKTDAYNQDNYSAIGAGTALQQQLYGQQLQSGEFANQAQAQQYGQNAAGAAFNNAAQGQANSQNAAAAAFHNAAQGQEYGQNYQSMQAANAAQSQANQQSAQAAQFHNATQGQTYTQNMGQAGFANSAYGQNNATAAAQAGFYNDAQNTAFNQGLQNVGLNNAAQGQAFQQGSYAQQLPINEFTALMGSGQTQMPTTATYTPTQVGQTDVTGAYALNQKAQQDAYAAKLQQQQGIMGGLFNLGSAAIFASDVRLKHDVLPLYTDRRGRRWYGFRYVWEGADQPLRFGVMAQEVRGTDPHAVLEQPGGTLAVDYAAMNDDALAEVAA